MLVRAPEMPATTVPSRVPSSLLYQVEQELGEDEKEALSFMCRDVAPDLPAQDVHSLLDTLNDKGLLAPHGLSELIYRARRYDLLKRLLQTDKATVAAHVARNQLVSEYRVLMLDISEELDRKDVESLVFLLRDYVGHGRLAKIKTFLAVATELEKAELIAPQKTDLLEKCLQNMHRMDLRNRILKYKQSVPGPAPAKSSQRLQMNVLQASLPNLRLSEPLYTAEVRRSEIQRSERIPCQAAEIVRVSVEETGACVNQGLDDGYKIRSRPLGICLILDCIGNNACELQETFTALHFEVQCYMYLTLDNLIQTVRDVATTPRHRDYDSFVCVLVSRGSSKAVFGTDEAFRGFPLAHMKNLFTGALCPALVGKPKLFFIQSYVDPGRPEELSSLLEIDGNDHGHLANGGDGRGSGIPNEADIFWSHCKVDSSVLHKSSSTPSYYLSCLSHLLTDHQKRRLHLLDIHTELNHKVYERNAISNPREQYSLLLQHTLRKKLFLMRS